MFVSRSWASQAPMHARTVAMARLAIVVCAAIWAAPRGATAQQPLAWPTTAPVENKLRSRAQTETDEGSLENRLRANHRHPEAHEPNTSSAAQDEPAASQTVGPWWESQLHQRMRSDSDAVPVDLQTLILRALQHSAQIRVLTDIPLVQQTAIVEADAEFDWRAFVESRWDDISEPVGSVLTAGPDASRWRDDMWNFEAGVRRRNSLGGRFEISQRMGRETSNSIFFLPPNQGTARLSVSYTQPLLRGAGRVYNTSLVLLAQIDTEIAHDQLLEGLQTHLLKIAEAYWQLYLCRGALLQKSRLYERAQKILDELEGRAGLDAAAGQIARVRAAVAEREADLLRAETAVRNAEERIRALVNDPAMAAVPRLEMVPQDVPVCTPVPLDMAQAVAVAYRYRPEIDQALRRIKAASVRLNMSKNELLPQLDLVLESYASGLRGEGAIGRAFADQFSVGEPSYSVGLTCELPLANRAARARHQRRLLELRQLQNQFRATVEMLMLDVKVAVREVDTTYREMLAKGRAMQAAEQRLDYIRDRWEHMAGDDRSAGLYLEDLLQAQQQLASTEFEYLRAVTDYSLAVMKLKRATGSLLQDERITHTVVQVDSLPEAILDRVPESSSSQMPLRPAGSGPWSPLGTPAESDEAERPMEPAIPENAAPTLDASGPAVWKPQHLRSRTAPPTRVPSPDDAIVLPALDEPRPPAAPGEQQSGDPSPGPRLPTTIPLGTDPLRTASAPPHPDAVRRLPKIGAERIHRDSGVRYR